MQAKTGEVQARNGDDVANTGAGLASDHISVLLGREKGHPGLGLLECFFPASNTGDVGYEMLDQDFKDKIIENNLREG